MDVTKQVGAVQLFCVLGLAVGMAAALAWYYDVFVNWQQRLYPLALIAANIGVILLTLFVLKAQGERRSLALLWKAVLSMVVFTGVLVGVTAVIKDVLRRGTQRATVAALLLVGAQVLVLYILLLRGQRKELGRGGIAVTAAVLAVSVAGAAFFMWNASRSRDYLARGGLTPYQAVPGQTTIHFINTGSGDAILLESDGHFALIDAGEDSENHEKKAEPPSGGYELYVLNYVKRVTGRHLDFILGTHMHTDHIGGFDTLILDPDITIGKAFLKPYITHKRRYENNAVNRAIYDQMTAALAQRGVPLIQDIPEESFALGAFTITIFSGGYDSKPPADENDNSLGVLVEAYGLRAFLAGDMNNYGGRETRLAPLIGKVDLVKSPHHGGEGSSTKIFVSILAPRTVISTGPAGGGGNFKVQRRYAEAGAELMLCTGDFGGIAAVFGESGITCYSIGEYPSGVGGTDMERK